MLLARSKAGSEIGGEKGLTLMDIYYKEEKLLAWRDSCLKTILNGSRKAGKLQEAFNEFITVSMDADSLSGGPDFMSHDEFQKSLD